ncbi:nuclear factor related to kappa-B-binding protein-like [Anopheles merus]|uniref:nuclear factor related to kappa-B-binding protein-like n=1 Tax=Anopheles merus TaxID=30066 RepID=UPI001BE467D3|nr:nuclear factor related to kappa-B-binding protein-like [Anopheles merus]
MAFTYKQHSYDSVVGPVKGIYTQAPGISKARGHSMLVANRPNFVTILTLVRDATARLPNGEGTRADICELLKSSQYISPTATDQILQTIVSGALDRMHTEHDPCVKYDAKRKIWIYLHRNRTEQEFERLHMQYQGLSKHKKSIVRKSIRQSRESLTTATSKISNLAKQHQIDDTGPSRDNVASVSSAVEILRNDTTEIINAMDSGIDLSAATSIIHIPTTIVGNTVTVARSTTSLLKKQVPLTVIDSSIVQQSCVDTRNENRSSSNSPSQTDRTKKSINIMQDHQLVLSDSGSDTIYKSSSKLYNAVTLITSSGNNVRTIQIPKSSISLSNRADVASNHITVTGNEALTSELSAHNTSPQSPKKIIVSAVVSAAKTMVTSTATDFSLNHGVDNLQKLNTKPILVQSAGTASPIITPSSCSFSKDAIKISSAIGGTIVSIRQVNNTNLGTLGKKNQTFACAQSTSLLSPQLSTQAKRPQISMNSSSMIATTSAANAIRTIKGGTIISTAIEKPNYSSSVTSSTSKQSPNSSSMLQSNPATTVLSQKMMLSSARAYASSASESSNVPTVVAIKPTNSTNITTVTESGTNRPIIRPTANLFSTITLTKGQQSVLTPAKQQQIIQNFLSQNQKQSLITKQIVCTTDDAKQCVGVGSPFQLESHTAVPGSFKMQHNSTSNVKQLSHQFVKITPTRAKTHCISTIRPVSTIVTSSNSPGHPSASIVNQTSSGVKMIKMHHSTMLTSIEPQGMLNASTMCGANTVTISGTNNIGSPHLPQILPCEY